MRTTNIRFREKQEEDDRAWDILHKLEELNCKSQSALVVRALNAYYDQHLKKQADPYFETRDKEDAFADRIVDAIEKKVFSMLPTMVGMAFMQQMAGTGPEGLKASAGIGGDNSGQMGNVRQQQFVQGMPGQLAGGAASGGGEWEKAPTARTEVLTEEDDVEENEFLDTDLF